MIQNQLITTLDNLDKYIEDNMELYNNNDLNSFFKVLIQIICLDNGNFNKEVMDLLDILTNNMDTLNYQGVRQNILEIKKLL